MSIETLKSDIRKMAGEKTKSIIDNANKEGKKILSEAEEKTKQIIDHRIQEINRKLAEREKIELAIARIEGRKRVMDIKSECLNNVFKETENRLKEISEKKQSYYENIIVNYIIEAVDKLEGEIFVIQANKKDSQIIDKIIDVVRKKLKKSGRNVELKTSPQSIDIIGGVIVYTKDMKQYYVNTFESRLLKVKSESHGKIIEILLKSK